MEPGDHGKAAIRVDLAQTRSHERQDVGLADPAGSDQQVVTEAALYVERALDESGDQRLALDRDLLEDLWGPARTV